MILKIIFTISGLLSCIANPMILIFTASAIITLFKNKSNLITNIKNICSIAYLYKIKHNQWLKILFEFILLVLFACFQSPNNLIFHSLTKFCEVAVLIIITIFTFNNLVISDSFKKCFFTGFSFSLPVLALLSYSETYNVSSKTIYILAPIFVAFVKNISIFNLSRLKNILFITFIYTLINIIVLHEHSTTTKVAILLLPLIYLTCYTFSSKVITRSIAISMIIMSIVVPVFYYFINVDNLFAKYPKILPSFKERVCIGKSSAEKIFENPVSGNGFNVSKFYFDETKPCFSFQLYEIAKFQNKKESQKRLENDSSTRTIYYHPGYHQHNFLLQIPFDLGIFGSILFLQILFLLLKTIKIQEKYDFANSVAIMFVVFTIYIFAYSIWSANTVVSILGVMLLMKKSNKI